MSITDRYQSLRKEVGPDVAIILAAKRRSADEIREVIDAGAVDIGHNYVQEAAELREELGGDAQRVRWHMIGHLQKNKINQALPIFDTIQTVDSLKLAEAIDRRTQRAGKSVVPILLEINIAGESAKSGLNPALNQPFERHLADLVTQMANLEHVQVDGLMTMGPPLSDPEAMRPFFRQVNEYLLAIRALGLPSALRCGNSPWV